jgi:hypothetical protein
MGCNEVRAKLSHHVLYCVRTIVAIPLDKHVMGCKGTIVVKMGGWMGDWVSE